MGLIIPDYSDARDGDILMIYQDPLPAEATNPEISLVMLPDASGIGGTYTITIDEDTTDPIDAGIGDSVITAALEALPAIGAGNVQVISDLSNGSVYFMLIGVFAGAPFDIGRISGDASGVTGAAAPYTFEVVGNSPGAPAVVGGEKVLRWGKPWQEFPFGEII